jgi:hypothetical protein
VHHPHPILVTGAAGRVGARGPVVTKGLARVDLSGGDDQHGRSVRAPRR